MTKEQREEYIGNGGVKCPYCKSHNLLGHDTEINDGLVTQLITCQDCRKAWTDVYTLTGVEPEQ